MSADRSIAKAYALLGKGEEEAAIPALRQACTTWAEEPGLWQALGLCLRAAERLGEAEEAFASARLLAPDDKKIAQGLAQCRLEAGRDAVGAFADALALAPEDPAIAQGWVAAIAASDGPEAALDALEPLLDRMPDWLAGHWLASRLAAAAGRDSPVDRSIAAEIARRPQAEHLWHHRLFTLMHSRKWAAARQIAADARARFPIQSAFAWNEAAAASEAGDLASAEQIYAGLGPLPDLGQAIYRCRHWLRQGRPEAVAALHARLPSPTGAEGLYPYFAAAWRMLGDPRHSWLEPEATVGVYDLADALPPLAELAAHLRGLHNQVRQPIEQSVRGGTQTDGHLLLRDEPIIQASKAVLRQAVERHIAALPSRDPAHPQLRHRRDAPVRFAGSWSVRLLSGGHHDNHVHPEGWFSSALYIALPDSIGGDAKAGWLALGEPQQSLGLDVPPMRMIEPKPGRLVLFPSTMWHGTVPFAEGERLTIAFDVKVPPA